MIWVFYHLAQPLLPNSCQPKQNWADRGTTKILVNPTKVSEQMDHLVEWVQCRNFILFLWKI